MGKIDPVPIVRDFFGDSVSHNCLRDSTGIIKQENVRYATIVRLLLIDGTNQFRKRLGLRKRGFVTDPTRDIAESNDRNVWKLSAGVAAYAHFKLQVRPGRLRSFA